jgi:hypothetical protein
MSMGIEYFAPCSSEAFRERLQTAAIKRQQEDERISKQRKPSKKDKARGDAMRAIEDKAMTRQLGVNLEDLK